MTGWLKPRAAARYAGVSERSFREWLRRGLRHARLPSGRILIRPQDIDAYLEKYCEAESKADLIVSDLMREIGGR